MDSIKNDKINELSADQLDQVAGGAATYNPPSIDTDGVTFAASATSALVPLNDGGAPGCGTRPSTI